MRFFEKKYRRCFNYAKDVHSKMFILKRKIFLQFLLSVFIGRDSQSPGPSRLSATSVNHGVHDMDRPRFSSDHFGRGSRFKGFFIGCRYSAYLSKSNSLCSEAEAKAGSNFCCEIRVRHVILILK